MGCGAFGLARKVFLLAIFVISQLCMRVISTPARSYQDHVDRELALKLYTGSQFTRHYQLYSRCSGKHVQIIDRKVNANGRPNTDFAILKVETVSFNSQIRIQNAKFRKYLCFSRKARLTVRHNGQSRRCIFREIHTKEGFTELQSMANPEWYIGFKRNGKPFRGFHAKHERKRKCFSFIKRDVKSGRSNNRQRWGPGGDFSKLLSQRLPHKNDGDKT